MLNSVNLNDKSYEEMLAEAIAQIPLYSREWTNYNVSDPGITILQNLTAFQQLQQESINEMPEEARRKLLKLAGYTACENQPAEVLVQIPREGGPMLQEGHQLWSSETPYETMSLVSQSPWGLAAVYSVIDESYRDITRLLESETEVIAYPFGRRPNRGNNFVCVLDGVPEVGEPLILWMQIAEEELRTPFGDDAADIPDFSKVSWQYYTASGWKNARFEDETMGLLRSGAVRLWLEDGVPAVFTGAPLHGCALRCMLDSADYDRAPRLESLAMHLFPMLQQETRIRTITCDGGLQIDLQGRLPQLGNLFVYVKESENGAYYMYREAPIEGIQGRYYRREENIWGQTICFDEAFGAVPWNGADAVKVVCVDNEMVHHRVLTPVYGYDHQVIRLDLVNNVLPKGFLLAVEVPCYDGDSEYYFVAPDESGPDGFSYHIRSRDAEIVIDDPGRGGYRLYLAGCCITQGSRGNLRACTMLEQRGGYDGTEVEAEYFCPAPGRGGVSFESAEDLRIRFSAAMRQTTVAVRADDYEVLVRQTPGLCIDKVKAISFPEKNLVKIAVKPHTEDIFPKLSEGYLQQIRSYLEPRRMLTTRFEILQPRYVPVGLHATLSIRGMADHARAAAEQMLRQTLDQIHGPQNFGEWVRFTEVYQKLSELPFVEAVDSLGLVPENREAVLVGSDIQLEADSLCYPGTIRLTLREHGR